MSSRYHMHSPDVDIDSKFDNNSVKRTNVVRFPLIPIRKSIDFSSPARPICFPCLQESGSRCTIAVPFGISEKMGVCVVGEVGVCVVGGVSVCVVVGLRLCGWQGRIQEFILGGPNQGPQSKV